MKQIYLLGFGLVLSGLSLAQRPTQVQPASGSHQRAAVQENKSTAPVPMAPTNNYSNDVVINSSTTDNQRRVRLAVAFNGWLYAAFSTAEAATNAGGITIVSSRDNGQNWSLVDSYQLVNVRYPAHDLVVAGTDTNNLTLYMAGVRNDVVAGTYDLFIDTYNATSGAFVDNVYLVSHGTSRVNDVSLATDYMTPAFNANPYSVGLLYSAYGSVRDSIIFVGSDDGGINWPIREIVQTSPYYSRTVSLGFGISYNNSNGRYTAAWEELGSASARYGNIYTSRNISQIDGSWLTPINLDSNLASSTPRQCAYPVIASSMETSTDNDSSSFSTVILVQRDFNGDGTDMDVIGFYNKTVNTNNSWYRLDVANSGSNDDLNPDISYDPNNNNFLTVYYDSTNGKLPYAVNGINLVNPDTWTSITAQYNDVTTNLAAPFPRVEINPVTIQAAHVWTAEGGGGRGVAMFDAEYVITGVQASNAGAGGALDNLSPNPANSQATLQFTLVKSANVQLSVVNMAGQQLLEQNIERNAGTWQTVFDVEQLPAGVYFIRMNLGDQVLTKRLVVAH
jgi:hypothetical protein